MRARVMVEDTTRLYPLICAGMGSTPCGLKALAKVPSPSHYFIHAASPDCRRLRNRSLQRHIQIVASTQDEAEARLSTVHSTRRIFSQTGWI
jgi:hypothetical protein